MAERTFLITGATGFLGGAVTVAAKELKETLRDRRTLFMATANTETGQGFIEIAETAVAGAGSP